MICTTPIRRRPSAMRWRNSTASDLPICTSPRRARAAAWPDRTSICAYCAASSKACTCPSAATTSSGPMRRSRPAMPTSSPSACRSSPIPTCRHGLLAAPSSIRPIPRPSMAAGPMAISIIRRSPPERPTPTRCGQGPARIPVVIRPLVWLKCLRPAPSFSHLRSHPCDQRDSGLHRRSSDQTLAPDKLIGRRRRRVRFNEQVYRVMSFIHCLFTGLRATSWSVLIRDIAAIVLVLLTPHVVNGVYEFLQYGLTLNGYINGVYFVSPFVASAMVLVLHYRLYRAGWLSIRGVR